MAHSDHGDYSGSRRGSIAIREGQDGKYSEPNQTRDQHPDRRYLLPTRTRVPNHASVFTAQRRSVLVMAPWSTPPALTPEAYEMVWGVEDPPDSDRNPTLVHHSVNEKKTFSFCLNAV